MKTARAAAALSVVAAAALPARAAEQPAATREEQWLRLRQEKLQALHPDRPGFLERNILAFEKAERPSILDFNVKGFYPRLQAIGWGSQQAGGVRFWQPDIKATPLDVHAAAFYSVRRYEQYELQVGLLPHAGRSLPARSTRGDEVYEIVDTRRQGDRRAFAYASLRYRHLPEIDFFGLGRESRPQDQTTFLLQDASYDLVLSYQHTPRTVVQARAGFLQAFVGPGRDKRFPTTQQLFTEAAVPGLASQPDFVHLGAHLLLDGRDEPLNPHGGAMLGVWADHYDDRGSALYRFHGLAADARGYLPLGSAQRVLALRAVASVRRPAEGSRVPFYLQETLGGSHTLRGYRSFRFRGEKLVLLQAEYRWEAAPAVELAAFVDAGKLTPESVAWSLEGLKVDYGLGLRIKTHDAVLVRLDVARSRETTRLLLRFGPSF